MAAALGQVVAVVALFGLVAGLGLAGGDIDAIMALESPASILIFLTTFLGPVLALLLAVRLLHGLRFRDLLGAGGRVRWRQMGVAILVVGAIAAFGSLLALATGGLERNLPLSAWVVYLVPAVAVILLQVTAEELVFRGYLQPALAARFSSPLIWLILPSLLFGMLHWQPDKFGANAWLVVLATTLMGIVFGHVTAVTGNVSAAIGVHFANNCTGLLFVATKGELSSLSLWLNPVELSDIPATRASLIGNMVLIAIAFAVWLAYARRRARRLQ